MQTPLQALAEAEIHNRTRQTAACRVLEAKAGIRCEADRQSVQDYARDVIAHIQAGGTLLDPTGRPR